LQSCRSATIIQPPRPSKNQFQTVAAFSSRLSRYNLGKLALVLELKPMASTRINELPAAIENCDFEKDRRYVEIEPAE
jgi:hypothetical protein